MLEQSAALGGANNRRIRRLLHSNGGQGGAIFPPQPADTLPVDSRLVQIKDLLSLPQPPQNLFVTDTTPEHFIVIDQNRRYVIGQFEEALGAILKYGVTDAMVTTGLDSAFQVIFDNQGNTTNLAKTSIGELNPKQPRTPHPDLIKGPLGDFNALEQMLRQRTVAQSQEGTILTATINADGEISNISRPKRTPLESYPKMGPSFAVDHEIHFLKMPRTLLVLKDLLMQYTNSFIGDMDSFQLYAQYLNRILFTKRDLKIPSTCLATIESWDKDILATLTGNARIVFEKILHSIEESKDQPFGLNMALTLGKPKPGDLAMLLDYYQQKNDLYCDPNLATIMGRQNKSLSYWMKVLENFPPGSILDINSLDNSGLCEICEKPTTWEEDLENLVGMDTFKKRIYEIQQAKETGKLGKHPNLNFCFIGPTGVGKTIAARILSKFLNDMGILDRGHIVEKTKAGIVAGYVGQTGIQTRRLIEDSKGGVLFIDEAHAFAERSETGTVHNKGFDDDVLAELIPEMENSRGERAIVFAGYPEGMNALLESDEGFRGRFLPENIIEFKPYTDSELLEIIKRMAQADKYGIERVAQLKLARIINGMPKGSKTFANARAMRQLYESMQIKSGGRDEHILRLSDIPEVYEKFDLKQIVSVEDIEERFEGLVGLDEIKDKLIDMFLRIKMDTSRNMPFEELMPFIFSGNPGTGKTTVARIIGSIMKGLGLLKSPQVHEYTRATLVASYEGQTAIKIRKAVEDSVDGVFFLDEAYSLTTEAHGGFGREAVDELVKLIEEYKDKVLFIFAGYPKEMANFRDANPGLFSRLPEVINFKDFSKPELLEILRLKLAEQKAVIDESALTDDDYRLFLNSFEEPNARTITTAASNIITAHARRTNSVGEFDEHNNLIISREDLMACVHTP